MDNKKIEQYLRHSGVRKAMVETAKVEGSELVVEFRQLQQTPGGHMSNQQDLRQSVQSVRVVFKNEAEAEIARHIALGGSANIEGHTPAPGLVAR